jgi:hypothetical protein
MAKDQEAAEPADGKLTPIRFKGQTNSGLKRGAASVKGAPGSA